MPRFDFFTNLTTRIFKLDSFETERGMILSNRDHWALYHPDECLIRVVQDKILVSRREKDVPDHR